MNLQTFKAATMAEALSQVKNTIGHDALILHTRTYQQRYWLGLRRKEIVEITAGKGSQLRPKPRAQQQLQKPAALPDGRAATPQRAGSSDALVRRAAVTSSDLAPAPTHVNRSLELM